MIQFNERTLFSAFLFLFAALLLWDSAGMRADTVLVPRIIGVAMLLFAGVQFALDLLPSLRKKMTFLSKSADSSTAIGGEGVVDEEKESRAESKQRFGFIGWMVLFAALIYFIGMIYAIAISLFIYLRWISKQGWLVSILYPIVTALIVYFAFVVGLNIYYFM